MIRDVLILENCSMIVEEDRPSNAAVFLAVKALSLMMSHMQAFLLVDTVFFAVWFMKVMDGLENLAGNQVTHMLMKVMLGEPVAEQGPEQGQGRVQGQGQPEPRGPGLGLGLGALHGFKVGVKQGKNENEKEDEDDRESTSDHAFAEPEPKHEVATLVRRRSGRLPILNYREGEDIVEEDVEGSTTQCVGDPKWTSDVSTELGYNTE